MTFFLNKIFLVLAYKFAFLSLVGLHFHFSPLFQNVKPKNLLFVGLTTFVFVAPLSIRKFIQEHLLTLHQIRITISNYLVLSLIPTMTSADSLTICFLLHIFLCVRVSQGKTLIFHSTTS